MILPGLGGATITPCTGYWQEYDEDNNPAKCWREPSVRLDWINSPRKPATPEEIIDIIRGVVQVVFKHLLTRQAEVLILASGKNGTRNFLFCNTEGKEEFSITTATIEELKSTFL